MTKTLALAALFGLAVSAANACDFHKTAHVDTTTTVSSVAKDDMMSKRVQLPPPEGEQVAMEEPAAKPPVE